MSSKIVCRDESTIGIKTLTNKIYVQENKKMVGLSIQTDADLVITEPITADTWCVGLSDHTLNFVRRKESVVHSDDEVGEFTIENWIKNSFSNDQKMIDSGVIKSIIDTVLRKIGLTRENLNILTNPSEIKSEKITSEYQRVRDHMKCSYDTYQFMIPEPEKSDLMIYILAVVKCVCEKYLDKGGKSQKDLSDSVEEVIELEMKMGCDFGSDSEEEKLEIKAKSKKIYVDSEEEKPKKSKKKFIDSDSDSEDEKLKSKEGVKKIFIDSDSEEELKPKRKLATKKHVDSNDIKFEFVKGPMKKYVDSDEEISKPVKGPIKKYVDSDEEISKPVKGPIKKYVDSDDETSSDSDSDFLAKTKQMGQSYAICSLVMKDLLKNIKPHQPDLVLMTRIFDALLDKYSNIIGLDVCEKTRDYHQIKILGLVQSFNSKFPPNRIHVTNYLNGFFTDKISWELIDKVFEKLPDDNQTFRYLVLIALVEKYYCYITDSEIDFDKFKQSDSKVSFTPTDILMLESMDYFTTDPKNPPSYRLDRFKELIIQIDKLSPQVLEHALILNDMIAEKYPNVSDIKKPAKLKGKPVPKMKPDAAPEIWKRIKDYVNNQNKIKATKLPSFNVVPWTSDPFIGAEPNIQIYGKVVDLPHVKCEDESVEKITFGKKINQIQLMNQMIVFTSESNLYVITNKALSLENKLEACKIGFVNGVYKVMLDPKIDISKLVLYPTYAYYHNDLIHYLIIIRNDFCGVKFQEIMFTSKFSFDPEFILINDSEIGIPFIIESANKTYGYDQKNKKLEFIYDPNHLFIPHKLLNSKYMFYTLSMDILKHLPSDTVITGYNPDLNVLYVEHPDISDRLKFSSDSGLMCFNTFDLLLCKEFVSDNNHQIIYLEEETPNIYKLCYLNKKSKGKNLKNLSLFKSKISINKIESCKSNDQVLFLINPLRTFFIHNYHTITTDVVEPQPLELMFVDLGSHTKGSDVFHTTMSLYDDISYSLMVYENDEMDMFELVFNYVRNQFPSVEIDEGLNAIFFDFSLEKFNLNKLEKVEHVSSGGSINKMMCERAIDDFVSNYTLSKDGVIKFNDELCKLTDFKLFIIGFTLISLRMNLKSPFQVMLPMSLYYVLHLRINKLVSNSDLEYMLLISNPSFFYQMIEYRNPSELKKLNTGKTYTYHLMEMLQICPKQLRAANMICDGIIHGFSSIGKSNIRDLISSLYVGDFIDRSKLIIKFNNWKAPYNTFPDYFKKKLLELSEFEIRSFLRNISGLSVFTHDSKYEINLDNISKAKDDGFSFGACSNILTIQKSYIDSINGNYDLLISTLVEPMKTIKG